MCPTPRRRRDRDIIIAAAHRCGCPVRMLASEFDLTPRQIRRIIAALSQ
jgi:hypothetical protein